MSDLHKEINFETEICEYLAAHGWLYAEEDAAGCDRARALFPADVLAWVQATQPKAWDALTRALKVHKYNVYNQRLMLYQECLAVTDAGSEAVQSVQNQIVTGLLSWSPSKPWTH